MLWKSLHFERNIWGNTLAARNESCSALCVCMEHITHLSSRMFSDAVCRIWNIYTGWLPGGFMLIGLKKTYHHQFISYQKKKNTVDNLKNKKSYLKLILSWSLSAHLLIISGRNIKSRGEHGVLR